jgi:hypothetical protein
MYGARIVAGAELFAVVTLNPLPSYSILPAVQFGKATVVVPLNLSGAVELFPFASNSCFPCVDIVRLPFTVVVPLEPEVAEPRLILVVEVDEPPVPILIVFVFKLLAPVAKLYVEAPVEAVNILTV